MNKTKIILFCIVAACCYGIVHDQITVRVCVEYFTIAHAPIFHTTSPTMLGLCWGIAATVPVGICFGTVLASVAQSGNDPPHLLSRLVRPILQLLALMALSAFAAGGCGYQLSRLGLLSLPADLAAAVPASQHHYFMATWFAHAASYVVGLAGGTVLCLHVWRRRGSHFVMSVFPRTRGAWIRAFIVIAISAYIVWIRYGAH